MNCPHIGRTDLGLNTFAQLIALDTFVAFEILIYLLVISFMTYLMVEFLIKLNYYKEWHSLTFYMAAYIVLVLRVADLCYTFRYYCGG
jgi:hypothetical protein